MVKKQSKKKLEPIDKIKKAFGIKKLVVKNEHFHFPGRCLYKCNDQSDIIEVFFTDYSKLSLSDSIASLSKLEKLSIRYSEYDYGDKGVWMLTHLSKLPEGFYSLKNLRHLDLTRAKISFFSEMLGNLTNLKIATFEGNYYLKNLPDSFKNLSNLLTLDLSWNTFDSIPETVFGLKKLKNLNIKQNNINFIPDSFEKNSELSILDLGRNNLVSIPNSIGHLRNLRCLFVDKNTLRFIPESIGNLTKLQVLNVDNNETLHHLPDSIEKLTSLQKLYLGGTGIKDIPESIVKLVNLKTMGLSLNQTDSFSKFGLELPNLSKIIIYPKNYRTWPSWYSVDHIYYHKPLEDFTKIPPSARSFFKELKNRGYTIQISN